MMLKENHLNKPHWIFNQNMHLVKIDQFYKTEEQENIRKISLYYVNKNWLV